MEYASSPNQKIVYLDASSLQQKTHVSAVVHSTEERE